MKKFVNLVGRKFGKLTVVEYAGRDKWNNILWLCQCECGKNTTVIGKNLKSGGTHSCGCGAKERMIERNTVHGNALRGRISREYQTWINAKRRCYEKHNVHYRHYGGRGIYMCEEWINDFPQFLKDMGPCPVGYTIDRIDNDGPYDKNNCKWATRMEQNRNQRSNNWLEFRGRRMIKQDWAHFLAISHRAIDYWLEKNKAFEWIVEYFMKKNKISWEKIENHG